MSIFEKITDFIGIEKFLSSIEDLFSFYLKPFGFYDRFFKKSLKEKIVQVIIYSILLILIGYITIDNITFRELTKVVIAEIALTFLIAVVLVTSDYTISKIEKRNPQSENIVFFVILAKLLISPFQVLFFGLFVNYENYNFFFIANLILFFQYIYVLLFSARVFNKKLKYIFLTILLNIAILNIFVFTIEKVKLDSYTTFESIYYIDHILKERVEKGKELKYPFSTPRYRVLVETKDYSYTHFVFSTPFDTIASGDPKETENYKNGIKQNIEVLDTMISNLKFKRNQDFFNNFYTLYNIIDSLMDEVKPDISSFNIENIQIVKNNDSVELYKAYYLSIPDRIFELNVEILNNEIETEKISSSSTMPLRLVNLFYPVSFIMDKNK